MKTKFIAILICCIFQGNYSMDLRETIKTDDVKTLEEQLKNGLNVNTQLGRNIPILYYALSQGAIKITNLLILNGANLNAMIESTANSKVTALYLALYDKIPIETVQLILKGGADINHVFIDKTTFFINSKIIEGTLFNCIPLIVNRTKRNFLINYLIELYGKDVLPTALSKCDSFYMVHDLVANNAFIPKNIIEIAKKLNINNKTIKFLQRQLDLNKVITDGANCLPYDIADLISSYSRGKEQNIDMLLDEAISNNDLIFIKYYIKNGGNPNHIIKFGGNEWSLLGYTLSNDGGSEEIATFLIDNGADVNMLSKNKKMYFSSLFYACKNKNISSKLVNKMLSSGAKIFNITSIRGTFKNTKFNLACLFHFPEVTDEKKEFLLDYLLKRFGQEVLNFVLESETTLEVIKIFIKKGAIVNKQIVEKAKKLNHTEDIIKYLNGYLHLSENLKINNVNLPEYPVTLINDYYDNEASIKMKK